MSKKDYPKLEGTAHHSSHTVQNQVSNLAGEQEWWNQISAEERLAIDTGLDDIKSGRTISHNEMRKRYEQWL